MPRIAAETVAEHVANQEAAVIAAASRLFAERGVAAVTLADVAAEVGLARTSLYRYYPDKAHLLAAWFHTEMDPLHERSAAIAHRDEPAGDRLDAWLTLHFDYVTAPEHRAMADAVPEFAGLADSARAEIAASHRALYGTLGEILAELVGPLPDGVARDGHVVLMFTVGLLRSASDLAVAGADRAATLAELLRSAHALCGDVSGR